MNKYQKIIRAFEIFNEYWDKDESPLDLVACHDELYAGPDPSLVSEEHKEELESLGWNPNEDTYGFIHYT